MDARVDGRTDGKHWTGKKAHDNGTILRFLTPLSKKADMYFDLIPHYSLIQRRTKRDDERGVQEKLRKIMRKSLKLHYSGCLNLASCCFYMTGTELGKPERGI